MSSPQITSNNPHNQSLQQNNDLQQNTTTSHFNQTQNASNYNPQAPVYSQNITAPPLSEYNPNISSQSTTQPPQAFSQSYPPNIASNTPITDVNNEDEYVNYLNNQINQQEAPNEMEIQNLENFSGFSFPQSTTPSPMKLNGSRIPYLMLDIQSDPRYRRLVFKYSPKKTTKKGFVQYCKNQVDPARIPIFGFFCDIYRSGKLGKYKHELNDMENNTAHTTDVSNLTINSLNGCLDAQLAGQSVRTAVGMLFNWIPFLAALPSAGFKYVAYKGSEKVVAKKHLNDTVESDVLEDYRVTKAFLLYLGHPVNSDPLYSRWENSRLELKEIFGARREDNLFAMSYDTWKNQENINSAPIPLLLLLWHVYQCEQDQYYSRIVNTLRHHSMEEIEKRERFEDEKWLSFDPSFDHDHHVQLITDMHEDVITSVLLDEFQHGSSFDFLKSQDGSTLKMGWWARRLSTYFIDKKQVWAYVEDDEQRTIRAVVLWQSHNDGDAFDPIGKLTKLRGRKALGKETLRTLTHALDESESMRAAHFDDLHKMNYSKVAILHYFGVWHDDDQGDFIGNDRYLVTLIWNIINSLEANAVVYAQAHVDRADVLRDAGFREMSMMLYPNSPVRGFFCDRDDNTYFNNNINNNNNTNMVGNINNLPSY